MVILAVLVIAVCVIVAIAIFTWEPNLFIFRLTERVFGKQYSHGGRG